MKLSSNSHETSPFNGSTPHILQTLGHIQGAQEAQSEDIREIKVEVREQGGRLRQVETSLTKLQERAPWWMDNRLWWLLAGIAVLLLAPADIQVKLLERLLK